MTAAQRSGPSRAITAASWAVLAVAIVSQLFVYLRGSAWAGPFEWAMSAVLLAAAVATPWAVRARSARVSVLIGAGMLAVVIGFVVASLVDVQLFARNPWPDGRFAVVLIALCGLGVVGLLLSQAWARWLALALAPVGAVSAGLNSVYTFMNHDNTTWGHFLFMVGGAVGIVNLMAPAVVERFARRETAGSLSSSDPLVASMRRMLVGLLAAIPMLLVYAWMQPIVPATAVTAQWLAVGLTLAAVLAIRGRVIGALLLVALGVGLLIQTVATVAAARSGEPWLLGVATYYAVFWLPGAALAIACGARMARPVMSLLGRQG